MQLVLELIGVGMCLVNGSGTIVDANALFLDVFGLARCENVINYALTEVLHTENAPEHGDRIEHGRNMSLLNLHVRTKMLSNGKKLYIFEPDDKGRFLSYLSHEMRSQLNGLLGFMGRLQTAPVLASGNKRMDTYLSFMQMCGKDLLRFADDLFDYVQLDTNVLVLDSTTFSIQTTLKSMEAALIPLLKDAVTLNFHLDANIPVALVGDETRFRQITHNILSNAIKFTNHGTIDLKISAERLDSKLVQLDMSVQDSGIGISEDNLLHLFEIDYRTPEIRSSGGMGFGLCLAQKLVQLMGGRGIEVESDLDKGTKFRFDIKLEMGTKSTEHLNPLSRLKTRLDIYKLVSKQRIIFVDDDRVNRAYARELFREFPPKDLLLLQSGKEVLDTLDTMEEKIDLIIIDCYMPIDNGFCTTKKIIEWCNENNLSVPRIVAMSASPLSQSSLKLAGMSDFILKPYSLARLLEAITKIVLTGEEFVYQGTREIFHEALEQSFGEIKEAWDNKDWTRIHRLAHDAKSFAQYLEKKHVYQAARDIEVHGLETKNNGLIERFLSLQSSLRSRTGFRELVVRAKGDLETGNWEAYDDVILKMEPVSGDSGLDPDILQWLLSSARRYLQKKDTRRASLLLDHVLVELDDGDKMGSVVLLGMNIEDKRTIEATQDFATYMFDSIQAFIDSLVDVSIVVMNSNCIRHSEDIITIKSAIPSEVPILLQPQENETLDCTFSLHVDGFIPVILTPGDVSLFPHYISQKKTTNWGTHRITTSSRYTNNNRKMLIIEDNPVHAKFMRRMCEQYGQYECSLAKDGKQGLNIAKEYDYDLILVDVLLPDMHGYDLIENLRTLIPECSPIIMVSGSDDVSIAHLCMQKGADGYVVKPLRPLSVHNFYFHTLKRYQDVNEGHAERLKTETAMRIETQRKMRLADNDLYHLMKNIFGGMLGLLDVYEDKPIGSVEKSEIIQEIAEMCISGQDICHYRKLFNDVVDKSYVPQYEAVSTQMLLRQLGRRFSLKYPDPCIKGEYLLKVDRRILHIILNNAVSNARKYGSKKDKPHLEIYFQGSNDLQLDVWNAPGDRHASLVEKDRAPGGLSHLFLDQERGDMPTFYSDGTGLATSQKCAETVGYNLCLSAKTKGVCLSIYMPGVVVGATEKETTSSTPVDRDDRFSWRDKCICFIDDSRLIRRSYMHFIQRTHCRGRVLGQNETEIEDAGDLIMAEKPDIVVIDQNLESPEKHRDSNGSIRMVRLGTNLSTELKARGFSGLLVARTANNSGQNIPLYLECGFDLIIGKDVRLKPMQVMIEEAYMRKFPLKT